MQQPPVNVFVLYWMGPGADGTTRGRFLGVYSSQREAARAVERLQERPEYRHYPKGFQVEAVQLDQDCEGWPDLGPPPPDVPYAP